MIVIVIVVVIVAAVPIVCTCWLYSRYEVWYVADIRRSVRGRGAVTSCLREGDVVRSESRNGSQKQDRGKKLMKSSQRKEGKIKRGRL